MASEAESLLPETGWLPELLRTPGWAMSAPTEGAGDALDSVDSIVDADAGVQTAAIIGAPAMADLIRSKILAYAQDPASQVNNVKALKGRDGTRLRVGDWRVIMDDQGNIVAVLDIGPRGGVYD